MKISIGVTLHCSSPMSPGAKVEDEMKVADLIFRFLALSPKDRKYFLRRFIDHKVHARGGFAQFGEDASVASYLKILGRVCERYIDIGANDPVLHSNTYMFYRDGGAGLLVEPNPILARRIVRKRPRDMVFNGGVVPKGSGTLDLFVMDMNGLSTLADDRRDHVLSRNLGRLSYRVRVPVIGINDLLARHVREEAVDFASIDIEGLDLDVLDAWDFDRWRPYLFCVETTIVDDSDFVKDLRFGELMVSRGYRPLFETFANTVFVDARP